MLAKKSRLTTKQFDAVLAAGKTFRGEALYIKVLFGEGQAFAVAVPKKVVVSSVRRHLVKRRVFASLRQVAESFPDGNYIVFVTKEGANLPVAQLTEHLLKLARMVATSPASRL